MNPDPDIRVNGGRLWQSIMEMAEIGATERGGSCRLALSDEDKAARVLFEKWCQEAGCTTQIDRMGSIFARRRGNGIGVKPVGVGSHLDTQPHGGKFDGVYGVMAALEVVRTMNDHGIDTEHPVEIVNWTNEEGCRFAPPMVASGVFAGVFDLEYALSRSDLAGVTIGDELKRLGYAGKMAMGDVSFESFFEIHIEQGPVLEQGGIPIGIVQGAQGMRWHDVRIEGQDSHAGTTPMENRHDALVAAAGLVLAINQLGLRHRPSARTTVGFLETIPGSRNTIPGRVNFTTDLRAVDPDVLDELTQGLQQLCALHALQTGVEIELTEVWSIPTVHFDPDCVQVTRAAARSLGLEYKEMFSGAGHDACHVARAAPTSMIFVPCAEGISHNEAESARREDLEAGANVLLHSILKKAKATP